MTDPSPTDRMPLPDPASTPPSPPPPPTTAPPPPTWQAPASRDTGRTGAVVFGLILLVVGLWFFAERTIGLDMPDVSWGQFWPLILIGLGAWVLLGSMRRGR